MNTYRIWFSRVMILGFIVSNFFALPGIFYPAAVAGLIGAPPPAMPIWLAFAFLLSFLVSWFYIPAALDPLGNLPTACLSVAARFVFVGFWLFLYRHHFDSEMETLTLPWIWKLELAFGIVQLVLLILTVRTPSVPVE